MARAVVNGYVKGDKDFEGLIKAKEKWEEKYKS